MMQFETSDIIHIRDSTRDWKCRPEVLYAQSNNVGALRVTLELVYAAAIPYIFIADCSD